MTNTILAVKGAIAKIDAYPILLDFIISKHVDFNKNTVGIRTARRDCDLLEEFSDYLITTDAGRDKQ